MQEFPKILVITPTVGRYYNGKRIDNMPRVYNSISKQTYPNIHHVVTSDKNRYASESRNRAIAENPKCPLIAYHDDDIFWSPTHLMSLYDNLVRRYASFSFSGSVIRTWGGLAIWKRIVDRPSPCKIDTNELLHWRYLIDFYGGWQNCDNNDWVLVSGWLKHGEVGVSTGFATSNYVLKPSLSHVLGYLKSQIKHSVLPHSFDDMPEAGGHDWKEYQ